MSENKIKRAREMHHNDGVDVDITPLMPQGTNSTMFTACCGVAICDDELTCPYCNRKVIGWDAESNHQRNIIRWKNATRHWKRSTQKGGK